MAVARCPLIGLPRSGTIRAAQKGRGKSWLESKEFGIAGPPWSLLPVHTSTTPPQTRLANQGRRTINEFDAKRLLATYGIPIAQEQRVTTAAEATAVANAIGYPVVLKALSDSIAHKTELGLVAVNLKDDAALARAYAQLNERLDKLEPRPADVAFLVQEFVADGIEVFAGVSRDPDFGLSLAFGMGGVAIEVVRDFALRMLPLRDGDAEAMIAETRGAALFGAVRGRPASDVKSLATCLYALADFASHHAALISEIDLNPIKVLPEGRGCVVVDALIVAQPSEKK